MKLNLEYRRALEATTYGAVVRLAIARGEFRRAMTREFRPLLDRLASLWARA